MKLNILRKESKTNDKIIRLALRHVLNKELKKHQGNGHEAEIFEELGVLHGKARIDLAIINGIMCGYEIKSDRDTLKRLPEQVEEFNEVFDKLTLVVGKNHLYHAMHIIPDWWGVIIAKENTNSGVVLQTIRKAEQNKTQEWVSIARLLWRGEALNILEQRNEANGVRYKPREFIYKRLTEVFVSDTETLKGYVSSALISRKGWRVGQPQALYDD